MTSDNIAMQLEFIEGDLLKGHLKTITKDSIKMINDVTMDLLSRTNHSDLDIMCMKYIIEISNILYNNTDKSILPLEDGVYDVLLELYKTYNANYQVGAPPVIFEESYEQIEENVLINPIIRIDRPENELFFDDLISSFANEKVKFEDGLVTPFIRAFKRERMSRNTAHNYPELVGTLDKCKFVLNKQAIDHGVFDNANVKIFERDFMQEHISKGIITPNEILSMALELKYDGVSVEADICGDKIIAARSRGDTNNNLATDLTPILEGYKFPRAFHIDINEVFGMKFEAIITYDNLKKLCELKGKEYKNCRNAIVGIFGDLNGRQYRDLITLVPLAIEFPEESNIPKMNRVEEIKLMNKFYSSGEMLRHSIIFGDYQSILFQVKKFVEEAEYMRSFLPFMYDGVVVSYINESIRKSLGRENSVNKYSMAIKFNAMKKQTIFLGYDYKVGQNGVITPMLHYNPVEFYGTIHTKSSGHSYKRFRELALKEGDIITVEYTNDVMPYVTKPDLEVNRNNPNPVIEFIDVCPSCGNKLKETDSGKSMICDNMECPERNITRMGNMLQKLNFKDFSEETIRAIQKFSLTDLICIEQKDVAFLGEITSKKLIERIQELKSTPVYDYNVIGSLGFSSIAVEKWKLIMNKISLNDLISMTDEDLSNALRSIKGIGPVAIDTIIAERSFFMVDLMTLVKEFNIIQSIGMAKGTKIRFTGVRDQELVNFVKANYPTCDIGEGGVTKDTNILIIPYENFTSTKTANAVKNGIMLVPLSEFKSNIEKYLK